jgi:IS66 Orf2 like protein
MAHIMDLNRAHTWRQRHQRQKSSGLSVAAFCSREGISPAAFYAWKHRLAARSLPALPEPPLFVPVDLDPSPRQTDAVLGRGVEFDRDGLAIWYKRLEAGSYQIPHTGGQLSVELQPAQLAMLLSGIDLRTARQRKRFQLAG